VNGADDEVRSSLVLYCLIGAAAPQAGARRFLLVPKQGRLTFPPTKLRQAEDLYHALVRPMEEDLGLPPDSYFPEQELKPIPSAGISPRYPGLPKKWHLYPVVVSLAEEAWQRLQTPPAGAVWLTLDEILAQAAEPNVRAIAAYLHGPGAGLLTDMPARPSMDALASHWAASQRSGVRVLHAGQLRRILAAGSRAFNPRVADPYLPYQRQGLGFTWSFFTPKDKQDVHVHSLPAVEIYGVLEGHLQLWHKPMNQRGVRTWQSRTLCAGDWAEVEPLYCHFACWGTPEGLGTVVKAAGSGELAGVGNLGVAGKTTCEHCNVGSQCLIPPSMQDLLSQYAKPFSERDYVLIARLVAAAQQDSDDQSGE
jgi:hypothetical protein